MGNSSKESKERFTENWKMQKCNPRPEEWIRENLSVLIGEKIVSMPFIRFFMALHRGGTIKAFLHFSDMHIVPITDAIMVGTI